MYASPPQYSHAPASWLLTFWPWKGVRVACDVGYLIANFGLPRPLCSRLRPELRNRQTSDRETDVRQHRRLMPPAGGGHNNPGRVRPGRSDYVGQNMCDSVPTADECNSYVRVSAVFMQIGYTVRPDASWLWTVNYVCEFDCKTIFLQLAAHNANLRIVLKNVRSHGNRRFLLQFAESLHAQTGLTVNFRCRLWTVPYRMRFLEE